MIGNIMRNYVSQKIPYPHRNRNSGRRKQMLFCIFYVKDNTITYTHTFVIPYQCENRNVYMLKVYVALKGYVLSKLLGKENSEL